MHRLFVRLLLHSLVALPLGAQPTDTTHVSTAPLFTRKDAVIGGAVVLGTIATTLVDKRIAASLQGPTFQSRDGYQRRADQSKYVNERSLFAVSTGAWALGRIAGWEHIADISLHSAEAIALAAGVNTLIKGTVGRSRPFDTANQEPYDVRFGRGFSDPKFRSLPSLHVGGSYAIAAVISSETSMRWPASRKYVAPTLYSLAILPGIGRMYNNRHWASDVVLGTAIGIYSGVKVVRYQHSHPANRLDRWLLAAHPTLLPNGAAGIVVSLAGR